MSSFRYVMSLMLKEILQNFGIITLYMLFLFVAFVGFKSFIVIYDDLKDAKQQVVYGTSGKELTNEYLGITSLLTRLNATSPLYKSTNNYDLEMREYIIWSLLALAFLTLFVALVIVREPINEELKFAYGLGLSKLTVFLGRLLKVALFSILFISIFDKIAVFTFIMFLVLFSLRERWLV